MKIPRLLTLAFAALFAGGLASAHPPGIRTDRPEARVLPLPKGDDVFHFIIFGDRTGGPPEGIEVLAQAVSDTNLLDPDLVMTVGDLVEGYNSAEAWQAQMKEYHATMEKLRMPWFPVAGNHDIYWRGADRPETEHEAAYEKHFGPLWYWFAHKDCGFLVLFSDEGDLQDPEKPRAFDDPAQQKFSDRQLGWLSESLAEMKDLRHIFVFMHHPRWAADVYPGNNWDKVHELLVENGKVRACFAGHIHRLRYDGFRDGIEYFALATTGGHIPGEQPQLGYLHHFNVVTVRDEGIKVSALPVGAAIDPKIFTPERQRDIRLAQTLAPRRVSEPVALQADGSATAEFELAVTNPCRRPLEITLAADAAEGWSVAPDHRHTRVEPGGEKRLKFSIRRAPGEGPPPEFSLAVDYLDETARATLPPRKLPLDLSLGELPEEIFADPENPIAIHIGGDRSGVAVASEAFELPDGPLTLEAWIAPDKHQDNAGIITKTENSEFGFFSENGRVSWIVHLDAEYAKVLADEPLEPNAWTHLAGTFDGETLALFVNGRKAGETPASGSRTPNDLPLYLGADPDGSGQASRAFQGWIDEVRLSKTARYDNSFDPARRHEPDGDTVLLFHADGLVGPLLPDHSASRAHGRPTGDVDLGTPGF